MQHLGELAQLINSYRKQNGLASIPISQKLTAVAWKHVSDLTTHQPEKKCNGNLHSWSQNGKWKGGCYDSSNKATWPIMWEKPKEIANYSEYGFEIAYAGSSSAQSALNSWKKSAPHNAVILNYPPWDRYNWKALGAVFGGGYACAWFGEKKD